MIQTRGIWLTVTDSKVLHSRQNIADAIAFLADTGFNVIFPVVWRNAMTLYPSQIMRDRFGIEIDPLFRGRDPLAELIAAASSANIAVIPWFEYGFASSYNLNGGTIVAQKPHWAARDINGNLLKKGGFEWLNAFDSEVQDFLLSLVLEVVETYDVAGIQGDDRLPALPSEGGYDAATIARYRQQFNQSPPQNAKDPQWLQWRADLLTDFLQRLYRSTIALNPNLIISSAPSPYAWGLQEYLQDAQAWIDQGWVDLLHPQLYRRDFASYRQLIDRLVDQLNPEQLGHLAPGVLLKSGSYRISSADLLQTIAYNRSRGISGEVFFFYEGLREDNDALARVLKAEPYAQSAAFATAEIKALGFTARRTGETYRFIDRNGSVVIQPLFDWVEPFQSGLAPVKLGYKWGYLNKQGGLITRLQFDQAAAFSEGLAAVKIGQHYGYIDERGSLTIAAQFDRASAFSEGLAAVEIKGRWGYIDKIGVPIIPPQFDGQSPVVSGMPQAIDHRTTAFSQGLAAVQVNNRWGYINRNGAQVIAPQFAQAQAFSEGLAAVQVNDRWGYIDRTGTLAIVPQFAQATAFSEGLAAVCVIVNRSEFANVPALNRWGYVNVQGQQVIPPEFDQAFPFSEGLAQVQVGDRHGYIRRPLR